MFKSIIKTVAVVAVLATGATGIAATTATDASARDMRYEFSFGGGGVQFGVGSRHGGHGHYGHRPHRPFNACSPRHAVGKARHMGVRHARVIRAGGKRVVVSGRKFGRHTRVVFANRHRCPVIAVR